MQGTVTIVNRTNGPIVVLYDQNEDFGQRKGVLLLPNERRVGFPAINYYQIEYPPSKIVPIGSNRTFLPCKTAPRRLDAGQYTFMFSYS